MVAIIDSLAHLVGPRHCMYFDASLKLVVAAKIALSNRRNLMRMTALEMM